MQYTEILPVHPTNETIHVGKYGRVFDNTLVRLFGCRHRELSRPFTSGQHSYIACLSCGMHQDFDLEKWTAKGPFHPEAFR